MVQDDRTITHSGLCAPTLPKIVGLGRATMAAGPVPNVVVLASLGGTLPRLAGGTQLTVIAGVPAREQDVESFALLYGDPAARLNFVDVSVEGKYEVTCRIHPRDGLLY